MLVWGKTLTKAFSPAPSLFRLDPKPIYEALVIWLRNLTASEPAKFDLNRLKALLTKPASYTTCLRVADVGDTVVVVGVAQKL